MRGHVLLLLAPLVAGHLMMFPVQARDSVATCGKEAAAGRVCDTASVNRLPRLHCESLLIRVEGDWQDVSESFEEAPDRLAGALDGSRRGRTARRNGHWDLVNDAGACQGS